MYFLIAILPSKNMFLAVVKLHFSISKICIYIYKLRPMLLKSNAEMLIHAFMTSRLDNCNALLGG